MSKQLHPAVFIATLVLVLSACKVSDPGKMESTVVKEIKKSVTIGGKDDKNPVAVTPEVIASGGDHFRHHCQVCHGLDGQNTGVPFAQKMSPPVPELTSEDVQGYTDGQLKWIIENGIAPSGMPAWKGILTDEEMWAMVVYIRNLPPKGSLGAPDVYKEGGKQHTHAPGTKPHKD